MITVVVPIQFEIDVARTLVHIRCTGDVSLAEILQYEVDVAQDPRFDPTFGELFDLSEATKLDVSMDEVRSIVDYERSHEKYVGQRRCAFVAPQDLSFGLARMYELLGDDSPMETQVFRELDEALGWLK